MKYLFRADEGHVFLTADDPGYRYELLCGNCAYPIEARDNQCPRCQRELETCPICTLVNHRKPPLAARDAASGSSTCQVCTLIRIPFGGQSLSEVKGGFCSNLYGCVAGGLLLKEEIFAVLPSDASVCPMCSHPMLRPYDVRTFVYHNNRCLFCKTAFGTSESWRKDWTQMQEPASKDAVLETDQACPICGRNDRRDRSSGQVMMLSSMAAGDEGGEGAPGLAWPEYVRVTQLGRVLALHLDDGVAYDELFQLWFDTSGREPARGEGMTVGRIAELLMEGTLREDTRAMLQGRLEAVLATWNRNLAGGVNYRVATRA